MPFIVRGTPSHDILPGVSTADHHAATVAGDLNLADLAERAHASLTGITTIDHRVNATKAEVELEEASSDVVIPSRIRHSPGVAKIWVKWEQTGAHGILASYNMTSVTDGGADGDTDHLWDDDFSSAEYSLAGMSDDEGNGTNTGINVQGSTYLAGGVTTETLRDGIGPVDVDHNSLVGFGDQ